MANHMSGLEEDDKLLQDDYYSFLNLPKEASQEEIINSYRRLSKLYHPDKHSDPVKKKDAEVLFNKTKKAYEVLIDPHKRAIYDTLGIRGLETEGWEIVQKTKTPQEIREEYERLARAQEERRLEQRTNPKGVISVGIDASDIFEYYEDSSSFLNLEINSMTISQSIEAPLTASDTATLSGNITAQNGTGTGHVSCSLRRVNSPKTWTEIELGAGNGLNITGKIFQTVYKNCFATFQASGNFTTTGFSPAFQAMIARQLDQHTVGYLTWKGGKQSSMTTSLVWDSSIGHFTSSIQFGIPNTFGMVSYTHKLPDNGRVKGTVKVGTLGALLEYGMDTKLSRHSTLGASVVVGIPSGITLKIKLHRASQSYVFPIYLSEEILPGAVFYATFVPLLSWYAIKYFVIDPYNERQKKKEALRQRENNATRLAERRREAEAAVSLMQETYARACEQERNRGGLIIFQALYGKLIFQDTGEVINDTSSIGTGHIIDVTVPLQCLVKDSKLILPESSKSNLPGFYDPCLGEEKSLSVRYQFRNLTHMVTISDEEQLRIPKESHLIHS